MKIEELDISIGDSQVSATERYYDLKEIVNQFEKLYQNYDLHAMSPGMSHFLLGEHEMLKEIIKYLNRIIGPEDEE